MQINKEKSILLKKYIFPIFLKDSTNNKSPKQTNGKIKVKQTLLESTSTSDLSMRRKDSIPTPIQNLIQVPENHCWGNTFSSEKGSAKVIKAKGSRNRWNVFNQDIIKQSITRNAISHSPLNLRRFPSQRKLTEIPKLNKQLKINKPNVYTPNSSSQKLKLKNKGMNSFTNKKHITQIKQKHITPQQSKRQCNKQINSTQSQSKIQNKLRKISTVINRYTKKQKQTVISDNSTFNTIDQPQIQNYQIMNKIGSGAFSNVYLVLHKAIRMLFAMKIIDKKNITNMNLSKVINREIQIHRKLQNYPNIVKLYKKFEDQHTIYMVMEYMPKGSLYSVWKDKKILEIQNARRIIRDVCNALKNLHEMDIIHRDVKLENVLLSYGVAKLADLGCSVRSIAMRKSSIGSPAYLSPQQLNKSYYNKKIDMWSLGILTYQLLIGYSPFDDQIRRLLTSNNSKTQLKQLKFPQNQFIEQTAKDFICKLLEKNPNLRMSAQQALNHEFIGSLEYY